jgi:2-methylcitrate dehydratase
MNRVTVRVDEQFEKDFPRVVHMRVTAKDKAGKSHQAYIVNPLGHEDNPVSEAELATKFLRLAAPRLSAKRAQTALELWQSIDKATDVTPAFDAAVVEAC